MWQAEGEDMGPDPVSYKASGVFAEWSPSQANAGDNCGAVKGYLMVVGQ